MKQLQLTTHKNYLVWPCHHSGMCNCDHRMLISDERLQLHRDTNKNRRPFSEKTTSNQNVRGINTGDLSSQLHFETLVTKSYFPKHSLNAMAKSTKCYSWITLRTEPIFESPTQSVMTAFPFSSALFISSQNCLSG